MGNALKSFKGKLYGDKKEFRILMIGLDAAGKTTILYKLKLGEIVTTIPTIGFNVETLDYKSIHVVSWDVGGRCPMRPLWRHYYQNTTALIYVVDSNDRDRIEDCKYEIHRLMQEEELKDIPMLVMANKQDLPNAMSIAEITDKLDLHKIKGNPWHIQSCCATLGDGLYEGLDWLKSSVENKAVKESIMKPVNETSEAIQKPYHSLSSMFSSISSYFSSAQ